MLFPTRLNHATSNLTWLLLSWMFLIQVAGQPASRSIKRISVGAAANQLSGYIGRPTWRHPYLLPRSLLAHALTVKGDDSRMRRFMHKLLNGERTSIAVMGSSISTPHGAKGASVSWAGLVHRWLEHTFGPCGLGKQPDFSIRAGDSSYDTMMRSSCANSSVGYEDLALGSTGALWGEKCMLPKVSDAADLVIIEYTRTAHVPYGSFVLDSPERRALERIVRRLLLHPNKPAIILLHAFGPCAVHLDKPCQFGGLQTDDLHNTVAMYYGQVQVLSMRSVLDPLVMKDRNATNLEDPWYFRQYAKSLELFQQDVYHIENTGHHLYADVFINYFQTLASKVISELLSHAMLPDMSWHGHPQEVNYIHYDANTTFNVSQLVQNYRASYIQGKLPPPMLPGNYEDSGGKCISGIDLDQYAVSTEGWQHMQEGRGKWGYVSTTPGSRLVLQLNTSLPVYVATKSAAMADGGETWGREEASAGSPTSQVELLVGYLKTYENIGNARVDCTSGCTCETAVLRGFTQDRWSLPWFHRLRVTRHPHCQITVAVEPDTETGSNKFKVVGLILSPESFVLAEELAGGAYYSMEELGSTG